MPPMATLSRGPTTTTQKSIRSERRREEEGRKRGEIVESDNNQNQLGRSFFWGDCRASSQLGRGEEIIYLCPTNAIGCICIRSYVAKCYYISKLDGPVPFYDRCVINRWWIWGWIKYCGRMQCVAVLLDCAWCPELDRVDFNSWPR